MSSALDSTTKSLLQSSLSDKEVSDPNGYGYIASLPEMRNQDAIDIQAQQNNLFALGAITGVSVIVFGILITSYSNGTK